MCLAIPMQITELNANDMARCRVGQGETFVDACLALLPEPPQIGEYVIVHAGFALRTLEPADAEETLKLLREIAATARPEDF